MLSERAKVCWVHVPRQVLAFYYGWYGNPRISGKWRGWENVDAPGKSIGNTLLYPRLGAYDSHDTRILEQHCRWAKESGIDSFIYSWWERNDFNDRGLPRLLNAAQKTGMHVTIYFEAVPGGDARRALSDVLYLLNRYGTHPAWLKINGKPVLFIYSRALLHVGLDGWLWVVTETNRQYEGGAVFIGDSKVTEATYIFDGSHRYGVTGVKTFTDPPEILRQSREAFPQLVAKAGAGRISCLSISPGGAAYTRPKPQQTLSRHGGSTYRIMWREAIAANPDWVLITSWNEWYEATAIEPSMEYGDRELKTTREYAARFKSRAPRQERAQPSTPKFENISLSILPDADYRTLWELAGTGANLTSLTWAQVTDPVVFNARKVPVVVYAGGESYCPTVKRRNDVLNALRRYVRSGGLLIVLPSEPVPFLYENRKFRRVNHAAALWLPLSSSRNCPPSIGPKKVGRGRVFYLNHSSMETPSGRALLHELLTEMDEAGRLR